jgi:hypothetical protein
MSSKEVSGGRKRVRYTPEFSGSLTLDESVAEFEVNAVSPGAGSPAGAEVRKEVTSGPPALPGRESARGLQHGGARSIEKASKVLPCKARVIRRRPDCLKPSHQRWKTHTLRHDA